MGQKVDRVVGFVIGLRKRDTADSLVGHGFNQAELDRGWEALRAAVGHKLETSPIPSVDPTTIAALDARENL